MLAKTLEFLANESGATAIEYAFVAGLVSIASLAAWGALGSNVTVAFESVSSSVGTVASGISSGSLDVSAVSTDGAILSGASR